MERSENRPRKRVDFLPRILSKWGACSRREAEAAVIAGRVTVNGIVRRRVLDTVNPERDAIELDGVPVRRARPLYFRLHKPVGVVTTMKDPEGRPTVGALIPPEYRGVMPVGRLDQDSSGLLIATNDHDLGERITGPDHRVQKIYHVEVSGHPAEELFAQIRAGIRLEDPDAPDGPSHSKAKVQCRPAGVKVLERRAASTLLEFVLDEGKNRQIRRSLETIGRTVIALHRVQIGPIELGDLKAGEISPLTAEELAALRAACA